MIHRYDGARVRKFGRIFRVLNRIPPTRLECEVWPISRHERAALGNKPGLLWFVLDPGCPPSNVEVLPVVLSSWASQEGRLD